MGLYPIAANQRWWPGADWKWPNNGSMYCPQRRTIVKSTNYNAKERARVARWSELANQSISHVLAGTPAWLQPRWSYSGASSWNRCRRTSNVSASKWTPRTLQQSPRPVLTHAVGPFRRISHKACTCACKHACMSVRDYNCSYACTWTMNKCMCASK